MGGNYYTVQVPVQLSRVLLGLFYEVYGVGFLQLFILVMTKTFDVCFAACR